MKKNSLNEIRGQNHPGSSSGFAPCRMDEASDVCCDASKSGPVSSIGNLQSQDIWCG